MFYIYFLKVAIDKAMVDMMATTFTPFNWVSHDSVIKLFDVTNPRFSLKSRVTYAR